MCVIEAVFQALRPRLAILLCIGQRKAGNTAVDPLLSQTFTVTLILSVLHYDIARDWCHIISTTPLLIVNS